MLQVNNEESTCELQPEMEKTGSYSNMFMEKCEFRSECSSNKHQWCSVTLPTHINLWGWKSPDIQNCSLIVSVPVASGDHCRLMDWTRLKLSA